MCDMVVAVLAVALVAEPLMMWSECLDASSPV
jgi:hypothetical protein